jgi:phosphatidylinositol alpha-1,6-mannosyltransferase
VLLLVGDGPDRRRLERSVRRRRLAGSVLLAGGVDWAEVPAWTDAGDVFAMPCRTRRGGLEPEAWGIVLLEALACGLPVVVGRSGGAPEAVQGAGGTVVADDAELVAALTALLGQPTPGERGRADRPAVVEWTWDACAEALDAVWRATP